MSEQDPYLGLEMADGSEVRMTRHNAALYTFVGKSAIGNHAARNHVFVWETRNEGQDDEYTRYWYVFGLSPVYQHLASFVIKHGFPQHLNLLEVSDTDELAFQRAMAEAPTEEAPDTIPEDWS